MATVEVACNSGPKIGPPNQMTRVNDAQNGRLAGTTLGSLTDLLGYNAFGEVTSYQVSANSNTLFQQADTLWEYLLAVVQGLFWPAFMVYEVFKALGRSG